MEPAYILHTLSVLREENNMNIPDRMQDYRLIPLRPNTKIAAVTWKNDTQYNMYDYPQATGYAIDTERSGLIVIDCDVKQEESGVDAYLNLSIEESGEMPSTLSVKSPSGGLHFYYSNPKGATVKSTVSKLAPAVDVRATGGYIVGPGSTITKEDGSTGTYTIQNNGAAIEPAPTWLLDLLVEKEINNAVATGKVLTTPEKNDDGGKRAKRGGSMNPEKVIALAWGLEIVENAVEGERQSTLSTVSYFLGRKRVPENRAQEIIDLAIQGGLSRVESERTFHKGYEEGLKEDELAFDQVVTSYNARTGTSSRNDPMDTGYYTHHNLAHNFRDAYPYDYIYWSVDRCWYAYQEDEGYWASISDEEMGLIMDRYLDDLIVKIRTKHPKITSTILRQQEKLWNKSFVEQVIGAAKWAFMNTSSSLFDKDRNLINCKNTVVNLKTGEALEHDRGYYMTKCIPVDYIEDAEDTMCNSILESIPAHSRSFMQLMAGQALTGHQPGTQVALFLHGRGSNGKSTFIDLMMRTSGDYGRLQSPSVLLSEKNGGDKFALADIEGLRLAVVEELPNAKVLDTGALKRLVGTREITARRLYENNRTFINSSTIFITCNRLPMVNETDEGTWRRALVINFPYSYKKTKAQIKGENDRLGSPAVLYAAQNNDATAEAFLAWRVRGARRWFKNAMLEAEVPQEILDATAEWNENNDIMLSWFNNTFTMTPGSFVTMDDLWHSYNDWATGKGNSPVSMRFFVENLLNHSVFSDNRLTYKKNARVTKLLKQSQYKPMNDGYTSRTVGTHASYITDIKFK